MKQNIWYALGGLLVGGAVVGGVWLSQGNNATLATVGTQKITHAQLLSELEKGGGKIFLTNLIDEEVINQAAKKNNITVTDQEVQDEIKKLKSQFPSEDAFNQSLAEQGTNLEELAHHQKVQLEFQKLATKDVKLTDDEIKQYYNSHLSDYQQPEQVKARHILVDTEQEAKDIIDRLHKGEDFAKIAKEKSKDTGSAANGGDLGFFGKGVMDPEFEKAAFSLALNQISDPVKTNFGYHVIQVTDKKPAKQLTLEEARPQVEQTLKNQKAIPPEQLLPQLRKEFNVKIVDTKYKDLQSQLVPGQ
ncbi:peptidylprolyl isomerase [Effusibacillus dendaii]|uniref:Foldase protein PrsA n=1 Tax=Effusibacillus dendaii TaxID=2743772 RepID=A0A7I8DAW8_9BACL|nr:peptidylprolyl isomerase [Effusibacillus dendaii]BCJ87137.1 hypothetical protein skT53_21220 [Effusibacillus dendaii]